MRVSLGFIVFLISLVAMAQDSESVDLELFEYIADFEGQSEKEEWVDPESLLEMEEMAASLKEESEQ